MKVSLRSVRIGDIPTILNLNHQNVAMLAPLDAGGLRRLQGLADRCDVIEADGQLAGFVVTVGPGTAYDSPNYRWFAERWGPGFYYLDRIVLDQHHRRRGIAGRVYDELEGVAAAYGRMTLEVNVQPPNPASLAFHASRGYAEVGRRGDDDHLVSLMVKELAGA